MPTSDALVKAMAVQPQPLEERPWEELLALRNATTDPVQQQALANAEHRRFARDYVAANPLAAPGLAVMVPAYAAAKALGLQRGRTPPSLDQVLAGWKGTAEGLADAARDAWGSR